MSSVYHNGEMHLLAHHCILGAKDGINFLQLGPALKMHFELESPFDYVYDSLILLRALWPLSWGGGVL